MSEMTLVLGLAAAFAAAIVLATHLFRRVSVALLTIRARSWVSAVSRILSEWVNATHYSGDAFFSADGADARTVRRRSAALAHLAASFASAHAKSTDWGRSVRDGFSDIRFADANRVPFPFARTMREKFDLTTVVTASDGPRLCDLDGQWSLDVSGSYGVNVAGFERYKDWIQRGWDRVKALGPVLGPARRESRHGGLWQDRGRRITDRCRLWPARFDAALRSETADAPRLRGRHIFSAPRGDGCDV